MYRYNEDEFSSTEVLPSGMYNGVSKDSSTGEEEESKMPLIFLPGNKVQAQYVHPSDQNKNYNLEGEPFIILYMVVILKCLKQVYQLDQLFGPLSQVG